MGEGGEVGGEGEGERFFFLCWSIESVLLALRRS